MSEPAPTLAITGPATAEDVVAVLEVLRGRAGRSAPAGGYARWRTTRQTACGYFCRWPAGR